MSAPATAEVLSVSPPATSRRRARDLWRGLARVGESRPATVGVRVDRVASPTEHTQYAAGYLAHLLGVPNFSPGLALRTRDKRLEHCADQLGEVLYIMKGEGTVSELESPLGQLQIF